MIREKEKERERERGSIFKGASRRNIEEHRPRQGIDRVASARLGEGVVQGAIKKDYLAQGC